MSTLQETVFLGATCGSPRVVRPDKLVHVPRHMRKKESALKGATTKSAKARLRAAADRGH